MKSREVVPLGPQASPGRDEEQGGGAGLRKLDCPLLQVFPNSCAVQNHEDNVQKATVEELLKQRTVQVS